MHTANSQWVSFVSIRLLFIIGFLQCAVFLCLHRDNMVYYLKQTNLCLLSRPIAVFSAIFGEMCQICTENRPAKHEQISTAAAATVAGLVGVSDHRRDHSMGPVGCVPSNFGDHGTNLEIECQKGPKLI